MLKKGELVQIFLPASGESISVLKAKLIQHSAYFRGIFQCTANDDCPEPIQISDVRKDIFTGVVFFLYENQLCLHQAHEPKLGSLPALIETYIFADKYDFQRLRNRCVSSALRALRNDKTSLNDVASNFWPALNTAFTKLPPTAKLYELLFSWLWWSVRDMCFGGVGRFTQEGYDRMLAELPHSIISELLRYWVVDINTLKDWKLVNANFYLEVEVKFPNPEGMT